jgi:hypothetical protein
MTARWTEPSLEAPRLFGYNESRSPRGPAVFISEAQLFLKIKENLALLAEQAFWAGFREGLLLGCGLAALLVLFFLLRRGSPS